jgi:hypothetical protein
MSSSSASGTPVIFRSILLNRRADYGTTPVVVPVSTGLLVSFDSLLRTFRRSIFVRSPMSRPSAVAGPFFLWWDSFPFYQ